MWSKYLCTRERNGIMAIFHELHPNPIFCSSGEWKSLVENASESSNTLVENLKKAKLIIESPVEDQSEFEAAERLLKLKLNRASILYLMTAQGCNFRCKYCPVPGVAQKYGESILSKEDAFAGIDLWLEHLKDACNDNTNYYVIFYGGEPLLNKKVIALSLEYLQLKRGLNELPPSVHFMIVTNGVLLDDEIVELFQKHNVMVAVGLDGPKAVNDTLRIDIDGNGTFDRIVAAIELLVRRGIRTFASVAITPANLDQIARYSEFFKALGVEKFGFNFLKGRLLLDLVGKEGLGRYYKDASAGVIENARHQGKINFEYQMEKKKAAFEESDYFPVDCTCYGEQLVIQPDGQISNCPFVKTWLGHVRTVGKNFRIWDQPIVQEWRKRLPLYHPGEAKALSGGGCTWSTLELQGRYPVIDESSRVFASEVLDEFIWCQFDRENFQRA